MNKEDSSGIKQTNAQIEDSSELKNMDNKIIKKNHENEVMQTPDENPGSEIDSWADEMDKSTPLTHIEPTPTPVKPPANRLTLNNPTRSPSQPVTNRRETPSTLNKLMDYERPCMTNRSQEGHLHDDRNSHMTLQPGEDYSVTTGPRDKEPVNNIAGSPNIENWTMRATQKLQASSSKKSCKKSKKLKKMKLLENSKNQAESGSFLRRSISATRMKQETGNNTGFLEKENDESIEKINDFCRVYGYVRASERLEKRPYSGSIFAGKVLESVQQWSREEYCKDLITKRCSRPGCRKPEMCFGTRRVRSYSIQPDELYALWNCHEPIEKKRKKKGGIPSQTSGQLQRGSR